MSEGLCSALIPLSHSSLARLLHERPQLLPGQGGQPVRHQPEAPGRGALLHQPGRPSIVATSELGYHQVMVPFIDIVMILIRLF